MIHLSSDYVVNEGITTKVFLHQGRFFSSLYKFYKGSEIIIHTLPTIPKELEEHQELLARVTNDCFLCFRYQKNKGEFLAYFEYTWLENKTIRHVNLEQNRGQTLNEALNNLEKTINKGRTKKYE